MSDLERSSPLDVEISDLCRSFREMFDVNDPWPGASAAFSTVIAYIRTRLANVAISGVEVDLHNMAVCESCRFVRGCVRIYPPATGSRGVSLCRSCVEVAKSWYLKSEESEER